MTKIQPVKFPENRAIYTDRKTFPSTNHKSFSVLVRHVDSFGNYWVEYDGKGSQLILDANKSEFGLYIKFLECVNIDSLQPDDAYIRDKKLQQIGI